MTTHDHTLERNLIHWGKMLIGILMIMLGILLVMKPVH